MNPISIRLLSQHLASPLFRSPAELVGHMGAVQAQDYRMMRWAVCMRTRKPSLKEFERQFNEGKIIRLHLLRGTWQLVSGKDYWWMLSLCADKSKSVIKGWMSSNRIEIPEDELMSIRAILVDCTEKKGSVTKYDFEDALAEKGIVMDNHRLSYHIRMAELDGVLCSGNLDPNKATYSLSEKKVPGKDNIPCREECLTLLARKYFQSHSPASMEDFQWWTGLNVSDCKEAVALIREELETVRIAKQEFLIHNSCRLRGFRSGGSILLPPYDEYLIGYKSREVSLDPKFRHKAHNNSGIFYPVILQDGKVSGNWKPAEKTLTTEMFEGYGRFDSIDREWERYQSFKGTKTRQ